MESQGGGRQSEDQLQSSALQNQELQPVTPKAIGPAHPGSTSATRVVVRLGDRVIKGYIDRDQWLGQREQDQFSQPADVLHLQLLETGETEHIPLSEAKAVFFVRNFEGVTSHSDIRFHDHLPPPECLWIRMVFTDGEVLEGMIENSGRYLLDPGFMVTPTDPTANNWLIYVPKNKVRDFEVLGLRQRTKKKMASLS